MKPFQRSLLVSSFFAGVLLCAALPAEAAFDSATLRCRATVAKAGTKLTRTVLKALAGCHTARSRAGALADVDCNAIASGDLGDKITDAETKFRAAITKSCTGVDPDVALYGECPSPCNAEVPSVTTFSDVSACMICLNRAELESFAGTAFGEPASPLPSIEGSCLRAITTLSSKFLSSVLTSVTKCQAAAEKSGNTSTDECTGENYLALVSSAFDRAYDSLKTGACAAVSLPGTVLDACDSATSADSIAYCTLAAAKAHGQRLVTDLLDFRAAPPVTTTTLPPADPSCPNILDVTVSSRDSDIACSSNGDCAAPRTCSARGKCTSVTTLDLGWTGLGHHGDINDGLNLRSRLNCEGTGGPACGECTVPGIDRDSIACHCQNDPTTSCDTSPGAASGDCPACQGGALSGQACASNDDCSADICTRRCMNNPAIACSSNAECPGSSCSSLSNKRCDNGSSCVATSDCMGTCTGESSCTCEVGAPIPLSSAGVPLCLVSSLAGDIHGTADVDSGASEIDVPLKTTVYLGEGVASPCPVCGGKCSNNAAQACRSDDDCGVGNTCTADGAGDGVRDGLCIGGRSDGLPCDTTSTNASLPASETSSGGAYSLDCLPDVGRNVSGAGLPINLTQTTGTSALPSGVSCGGFSPELTCPCRLCSGLGTAITCSSDSECSGVAPSCSLATSVTCSSDADCSAADVGPCRTIGPAHRCRGMLSRVCAVDSDCLDVPAGTCAASTCSSSGLGQAPLPNDCSDGLCTDLGGGEGRCTDGPDDLYCDGVVKADGAGIFACSLDEDCDSNVIGIDGGHCNLLQRRSCFPGAVTASGDADAAFPVSAATFCMPPTANNGINAVLGLPGPGRLISQGSATAYCASNPLAAYTPGSGGCP